MSDPYPPDIARALAGAGVSHRLGMFGGRLSYHAVVSSTNDVALELGKAGAPAGTSVVASQQSSGRGRRGRSWFSPSSVGVYVSVVLRDLASPLVTLLAGVATAEGIHAATDVPVELEWPNDLVVSSGRPGDVYRRVKLGGVLTEAVPDPVGPPLVVVGIGVNVRATDYPSDIQGRVSCLEEHAATPVDRGVVLVQILAALATWQDRWGRDGAAPMLERWSTLSPSSQGVRVAWHTPDGRRSGVTTGIDSDGSLRVRTGDQVERLVGGTLDWQPERPGRPS